MSGEREVLRDGCRVELAWLDRTSSRKTASTAGPRPWMFPLCDAEKSTQLFYPRAALRNLTVLAGTKQRHILRDPRR